MANQKFDHTVSKIKAAWRGGRHLLIVAPPKSASTYLANVLSESLQLPLHNYSNIWSGPSDVSIERALELSDRDLVVRVHSLPKPMMIALLQATDIKPVLLSRDIADSLVSMTDHKLLDDSTRYNRELATLPRDAQFVAVAYEWLHWYVRFHTEWSQGVRTPDPFLWLDYDDIVERPVDSALAALEYTGWNAGREAVRKAVDTVGRSRTRSNRNVGIKGRSRELPDEIHRAITTMRHASRLNY